MRVGSLLCAALLVVGGAPAASAETRPFSPNNVTRAATPTAAAPGSWSQLLEFDYGTQFGTLYTLVYDFGAGVEVDALQGQLFQYVGQTCRARLTSIDVALDPDRYVLTRLRPDANGQVVLPDTRIYKVGFTLDQDVGWEPTDGCVVRLSGYTAALQPNPPPLPPPTPPSPPPIDDDDDDDDVPLPPEGFELAGVIAYSGGYSDQERVAIWTSEKIDAVWARIPGFCAGLEVLEAGVMIDEQYHAARLADETHQIYEVNGGQGIRVDAVVTRLNGPAGLRCDLPIYIRRSVIQ